jgi:hypothetical protein
LAITRARTSSVAQGPSTNRNLLAGNPVILGGSYESIATANGTGSSGTITFSSIPSTYKHLQIRLLVLGTTTTSDSGYSLRARFNSDTGSNYNRHELYGQGDGGPAGSYGPATSQTYMNVGAYSTYVVGNPIGASVIDILDYANTNKNKTVRALLGTDVNAASANNIGLYSGLWRSTAAITSITLFASSSNFTTTSSFALYGIK